MLGFPRELAEHRLEVSKTARPIKQSSGDLQKIENKL
jgi:hypothetical protein